jgi:hypothetical protein
LGTKGDQGIPGPTGPKGDSGTQLPSFFPPSQPQVCGNGLDWDGVEALEGENKTGKTYYVGVNIPNPNNYTIIPAKNSFTQAIAEYTYIGTNTLTLSNFTIKATLNGEPALADAVGYTYYLLINNNVKSTIVLDSSVSPQTGNDTTSFTVNPGDKIVIKAVINAGQKKADDPDDIIFEWCANIA